MLPLLFVIVRQFQVHTILRASDTAEFQVNLFDMRGTSLKGTLKCETWWSVPRRWCGI